MRKRLLKIAAIVAVLAMGAALAVGCSSGSDNASGSSKASSSGSSSTADSFTTLIVGFDNTFAPYGYMDENNEPTGFDIDLAREVAKRNGWEIQLEPIEWETKDALLNQGSINCIWNGFTIEGREDDYTFTEPYMLNELVLVTKADSDIKSIDDLAGKIVITQAGGSGENLLNGEDFEETTATFKELVTIADYDQAFMQLESGMVGAVVCDKCIANVQFNAKPDVFVQVGDDLNSEHFGVGFALGQAEIAETVTNTLRDMYNDGTVASIAEKYPTINIDNWLIK